MAQTTAVRGIWAQTTVARGIWAQATVAQGVWAQATVARGIIWAQRTVVRGIWAQKTGSRYMAQTTGTLAGLKLEYLQWEGAVASEAGRKGAVVNDRSGCW